MSRQAQKTGSQKLQKQIPIRIGTCIVSVQVPYYEKSEIWYINSNLGSAASRGKEKGSPPSLNENRLMLPGRTLPT